jgi:polyisoprenoid-binding protein YceI
VSLWVLALGWRTADVVEEHRFVGKGAGMALKETLRRRWPWLLVIVPVALVVVVSAATIVYIHFIAPDPAPRLTFSSVTTTTAAGASTTTRATATTGGTATAAGLDGTWAVTDGSAVQYRVQEVLNGQDNEATGRSTAVTGDLTLRGTTVSAAKVTVDMKTFSSNESQRDGQFRNRIMDTSQFPTATFELTAPIDLTSVPDDLAVVNVKATGKLTLHGTTKEITIDLAARRNGANIEVNGSVPITFSDYGIDNPSGGPASVGNSGEMELLVVFARS